MKTAISLPDDLFEAIDARARALKLSRSAFIARAARAYLDSQSSEDVTEQWNRAAAIMARDPEERRFAKALTRSSARSIIKKDPGGGVER